MHLPHVRRGRSRALVVSTLAATLAAALALLAAPTVPSASATLPVQRAHSAPRASTVYKVKVPHSFYGVHDRYLSSLSRPSTGSIRLWDSATDWARVEPTLGTWDWSALDRVVQAAHRNGTTVSLVLGLSPSYAAATPTDAPDPVMYHDYVKAVMDRYRPGSWPYRGISSYQVWNEANVTTFWTGTTTELADLTKIVYDLRDSEDKGALVIAPAMVTRLTFEQKGLQAFYSTPVTETGRPVWAYVDAISLNLYPTEQVATSDGTLRPSTPEDSIALLKSVRSMLKAVGVRPLPPIWNTEINYGMGRSATTVPISNRRQVANVLRTYLLNAAQGVKRVNWYAYDMGLLPGGGTLGNTLLTDPTDRTAGLRTPAGIAFTRVQGWLKGTLVGTTTKRPCITDAKGTYTCLVRYADGVGRIYWNPYRTARVRLVPSASKKITGTGGTSRVAGGSRLKVDYLPVLVKSKK